MVDKDVPNNVRGVRSLLGAGRQSVLRQKEGTQLKVKFNCQVLIMNEIFLIADLVKKLNRERYVVRQNSRPRCNPLDLVGQPGVGRFTRTLI